MVCLSGLMGALVMNPCWKYGTFDCGGERILKADLWKLKPQATTIGGIREPRIISVDALRLVGGVAPPTRQMCT